MNQFSMDEVQTAISQLSPAAALELERNLFRNRLMGGEQDESRDEGAMGSEETEEG